MKKFAVIMIVLVPMLLLVAACQKDKPAAVQDISPTPAETAQRTAAPTEGGTPSPEPSQTAAPQPAETEKAKINEKIKPVEQGRVSGLQFGIGDSAKDIVANMGEPDSKDYFEGGLYLAYQENVFFTSAMLDESGGITDGKVVGLGFREGADLFGARVGMTFAEIEKKLGKADHENSADDNTDNQLYGQVWSLIYDSGDYQLIFIADKQDDPTIGAYVWKREDSI